jgi:formyl-CoA transferase
MAPTDWMTKPAGRKGNRAAPPTGLYPCKPFGRDDYVFVFATTDEQWDALCTAMDRPDLLVDPRFANDKARVANAEAVFQEVGAWTAQHTKHEAMVTLASHGAPAGATLNTNEYRTDPHLVSRNFVQYVDHPGLGEVPLMRSPFLMSKSQVPIVRAPLLGEHTDEVLCSDLGMSSDEIGRLREARAIR